MIYIYNLLVILGLIIILFKKKNLSPTIIFFLSSVVYYINAIVGKVYDVSRSLVIFSYDIYYGTYILLIINILIVLFMLCTEKEKKIYIEKRPVPNEKKVMIIYMILVFLFSVIMCYKFRVFTRVDYNKTELAEEAGGIATYYKYLSCFSFVYMYVQEKVKYNLFWKAIATFPIISTFMFGNRSFLIISIITVAFNYIYIKTRSYKTLGAFLAENRKMLFGLAALFFMALIVKGITYALFVRDYDLVQEKLISSNFYELTLLTSEPNTITMNLDQISRKDFHLNGSSYIGLWTYAFPFITEPLKDATGQVGFSVAYQNAVYNDGRTNRASTFIGEAYANGDYIMVLIVIVFYLIFLRFIFNLFHKCKSNVAKTMLLLMLVDGAFYIQRNTMDFQCTRFRSYIYITILIYLLIVTLNTNRKKIYI